MHANIVWEYESLRSTTGYVAKRPSLQQLVDNMLVALTCLLGISSFDYAHRTSSCGHKRLAEGSVVKNESSGTLLLSMLHL
jgi:hypothetical protein